MRARLTAALVIGIVALPVVFVGLIDPLEGGLALLLALALGIAMRLLSGVPVPRLAWISLAVTLALGILALILVTTRMPTDAVREVGPDVAAPNPINLAARVLLWAYRLGVLTTLVGTAVYVVRIGAALRSLRSAAEDGAIR